MFKAGTSSGGPLLNVLQPPEWYEKALCAQTDPDAFFPEGKGASSVEAKKICRRCDVREECEKYALDNDIRWGVWGAKTKGERKRELNRRKKAAREQAAAQSAA